MIQKFFCRDDSGRDLFFVRLHDFKDREDLLLDSSLGIDLEVLPELKPHIDSICRRSTTEEGRIPLLNALFSKIQSIPGIQAKYLPEYTLDKWGRFNEGYCLILHEVIAEVDFPDYTPFSVDTNGFYFERIRDYFMQLLADGKLTQMTQEHFVELLPFNPLLQELYVEHLSNNMEFYFFNERTQDSQDEYIMCFCMLSKGALVFFFVQHFQKSQSKHVP